MNPVKRYLVTYTVESSDKVALTKAVMRGMLQMGYAIRGSVIEELPAPFIAGNYQHKQAMPGTNILWYDKEPWTMYGTSWNVEADWRRVDSTP